LDNAGYGPKHSSDPEAISKEDMGSRNIVALAISTDFQVKLYALLNSQYSFPSAPQNWAFGLWPGEQRSLKMFIFLQIQIFRCWMESEQRVIIRSLLKTSANADDIHRRLQAQFTDDAYSIRSVRRWCQFLRQVREDFHDGPSSGRLAINFINTKSLSALDGVISFCTHC
jgi:hypothetical protein